ncbi:hypothetical protein DSO57_1024798 [Entomophthora muscae]|uniref:Uncharacterized protein n=2 Tax=Entomophthora muscae TaxID=34485 RepID=A0ACC2SGZ2_9FUNG|nr:hypothetical protein DSO57_1020907 [Entomophthora muscae]KAJ9080445.1 hypothetical protein DSO57_1024798 [Entomophthora muscae]
MGFKGSTNSSGAKKQQRHKNQVVYVHQKQSGLTKHINNLPVHGICKRCSDIIAWRKQYGKYKPLTVPKKCLGCDKKAVKEAYHELCHDCARAKNVCAKCQEPKQIINDPSNYLTEEQKNSEEQKFQNWLRSLPERKRRSVVRKIERGDTVAAGDVVSEDDFDIGSDYSSVEEEDDC